MSCACAHAVILGVNVYAAILKPRSCTCVSYACRRCAAIRQFLEGIGAQSTQPEGVPEVENQ